ncbi:hypothetical protein BACPEC_01843 [[Bacteroides] pectinophilus ATCC 43243]|uniref:Uncharacterized protein n=1 Tax=[Bacteroides] pectinophilus ATCC 43243 TaxID=483218 RepID=B7ARY9_9FIRM|nr:hypothetical protein BACPEC_01843 [[Bacteroides] pectinophilus ATCC 43243]
MYFLCICGHNYIIRCAGYACGMRGENEDKNGSYESFKRRCGHEFYCNGRTYMLAGIHKICP